MYVYEGKTQQVLLQKSVLEGKGVPPGWVLFNTLNCKLNSPLEIPPNKIGGQESFMEDQVSFPADKNILLESEKEVHLTSAMFIREP